MGLEGVCPVLSCISHSSPPTLSPCKDQQDAVGLGKEVVSLLLGVQVAPLGLTKSRHSNTPWLYLQKASCILMTAFVMQA